MEIGQGVSIKAGRLPALGQWLTGPGERPGAPGGMAVLGSGLPVTLKGLCARAGLGESPRWEGTPTSGLQVEEAGKVRGRLGASARPLEARSPKHSAGRVPARPGPAPGAPTGRAGPTGRQDPRATQGAGGGRGIGAGSCSSCLTSLCPQPTAGGNRVMGAGNWQIKGTESL